MDIVVKGRGVRLTPEIHEAIRAKLAKLPRVNPRASRAQVEVIQERNPKIEAVKRVEASVDIPRRTFRARGEGPAIEAAVDVAVERLGRQMRDYRLKKRRAVIHGANRLKSTGIRRSTRTSRDLD